MRALCKIAFLALSLYVLFGDTEGENATPIGNGVTVNASLFYDDRYYNISQKKKPKLNITEDLLNVLLLAEKYLHSQSVMVNFSVHTVQQRSDYLVLKNNRIDGAQTLQNMTQRAADEHAPNNSVWYHFAGYSITGSLEGRDRSQPLLSDIATNGTFCKQPSAAILMYYPGSNNTNAFVSATSLIFGAKGRIIYSPEDMKAMNETFQNCEKLG
uniref:28 kDa Metastriate family member n=1 Tax=Rhipicephalus appendiculatus TaxID=34631 RepID=A0A131YU21_RHIAP